MAATPLGSDTPGQQFIDDLRQVVEVDVPGNDLQRITQRFDLGLARCIGKEVKLDGAAGLGLAHGVIVAWAGAVSVGGWGFLEVPLPGVPGRVSPVAALRCASPAA